MTVSPFEAASPSSFVKTEMRPPPRLRIISVISRVPRGMVSTYGAVARAAGLGRGARQVAAALRGAIGIPWHRIVGAGGAIRLRGASAFEQRMRLEAEGVVFRGKRVNMARHEFRFGTPAGKSGKGR
jgi:methylated-DNA-protein-cysteine methyltransferase-like protein